MYDKNLILIGYSGHGVVLADIANEKGFKIIGYADKVINQINPLRLSYLGDEGAPDFKGWNINADYILGIGNNSVREKIYRLVSMKGRKVASVISPNACISRNAEIGNGVFINRNVVVNAFSKIGSNVILNTSCVIEHECFIGDNVHVAPGAVLTGNVKVGSGSFIGANSVIKQGIVIGENVVIGAGAVILADIPDNKKVVGNPQRFI